MNSDNNNSRDESRKSDEIKTTDLMLAEILADNVFLKKKVSKHDKMFERVIRELRLDIRWDDDIFYDFPI